VTYEQLPWVVDPDAAMKTGAPSVVAGKSPNFTAVTVGTAGDVDAGLKSADVTVTDTLGWCGQFQHMTPETRGATCWWVGDELWVWQGSQNIHAHRQNIANELGIPHGKVHFRSHGTGGGYGDRKPYGEAATIAAVLAKKAGMPVNCHYSRAVNTVGATHQYGQKATITMGAKKDGTLTGIDALFYADGGYAGSSSTSASANPIRLTYRCDNVRVLGNNIFTNTPRTGPFRSVGELHGVFLSDSMMDQLADKLGMDQVDFRLKNAMTPERLDQITGRPMSSCVHKEVIQLAADTFGWKTKWHTPGSKTLPDGRLHGVGTATIVSEKGGYNGNQFTATVNVALDGTVVCNYGIGRASCGTNTALDHVVAEALGVTIDRVFTGEIGNTDVTAYGGNQAGSRATPSNSPAAYMAAIDARSQLFTNAAKTLKTTVDQLDAKDNKIFLKSDPTKFVSHADATGGLPIAGKGKNWADNLQKAVLNWPAGTPATARTFVAACVEIAVDTETGEVEILSWTLVDDCGRVAFRNGAESTVNACMEMQRGYGFMWEHIYDPTTGASLNVDFLTQKIPTALDQPVEVMNGVLYEGDDAMCVYGIKGMGEPPDTLYVAFFNAFYNATGKRIKQTPMYPFRVLQALGKI